MMVTDKPPCFGTDKDDLKNPKGDCRKCKFYRECCRIYAKKLIEKWEKIQKY